MRDKTPAGWVYLGHGVQRAKGLIPPFAGVAGQALWRESFSNPAVNPAAGFFVVG
jgi:hypothetical protein